MNWNDEHLSEARARYHSGEPLVTAWFCPTHDWFIPEYHERCPGYGCNRCMVPRRGLWGTCAEFDGPNSWFYGYHELRERRAA